MRVFLLSSLAVLPILSQPSKRSPVEECCKSKTVGGVDYSLVLENQDNSRWGCINGCVYTKNQQPAGTKYCFAPGELSVACFHWCYTGDCGPLAWPQHIPACGGENQSPIDIPPTGGTVPITQQPITFTNYDRVRLSGLLDETADTLHGARLIGGEVVNNGHTAKLTVEAAPGDGKLTGGPLTAPYQMKQLHFHWGSDNSKGSEHTVNGASFPMEMHIVHYKDGVDAVTEIRDGIAVTGFFFQIQQNDNPILKPLLDSLAQITQSGDSYDMSSSPFTVGSLIPSDIGQRRYASYSGSLTTPGCNEAVSWIVFLAPLSISTAQQQMFRALFDKDGDPIVDNTRPTQPINGRPILFGPPPP